jgi:hypothetical protein
MDGATFGWVFTFLTLNKKDNKTENCDIIYATLVIFYIFLINDKQRRNSVVKSILLSSYMT